MSKRVFQSQSDFTVWNDAMAAKYDLDLFHNHPSRVVRYVEKKRIRRVFALLSLRPEHRVVEVGCGAGHLLAQLPLARPFGLDLSESLLHKAKRRLHSHAHLIQGDAEQLPIQSGAIDRVYCSEVLEHLQDPRKALLELLRVLGPHGVAVVSVPNERLINRAKSLLRRTGVYSRLIRTDAESYSMPHRMDDEWHLHSFDRAMLHCLAPSGFTISRVETIPFKWLPLRYVMRLDAAGRPIPSAPARAPHPLLHRTVLRTLGRLRTLFRVEH